MWWIGGSIRFGVLVFGFFGLMAWEKWNEARVQANLKKCGKIVKGWIVFANDQLYLRNPLRNMWPAQVVFTLDPKFSNDEGFLEQLADAIRNFKTKNPEDHDERIIGQVVRTHPGYYEPLAIPKRLTGEVDAYTVTVNVPCELLPKRKLVLPYICGWLTCGRS
jgi:hypothetical protein